ncbi:hypothetical protein [Legionella bononiensis]|uniref:Uncharacterized protein n=1 Tax=Legionella bononiensis TaxID=2793102 RepID=A0ABS1WG16_9GAMM|nr:hypothetical protein [Legionella bononiensis]MBL7481746.1 hypothetical protein [Legionella bononiensis]MBL7528294.1 hypothetical protein [Legionella bononiensis]MBL7562769.1 hypothetical protein [Legionella bononiensis]
MDLKPLTVDSAIEPLGSSNVFDSYEKKAKAYNQKISGYQNDINASELIQQAGQVLAQNPELVMA